MAFSMIVSRHAISRTSKDPVDFWSRIKIFMAAGSTAGQDNPAREKLSHKKEGKDMGTCTIASEVHFTLVILSKSHITSRPMVRS